MLNSSSSKAEDEAPAPATKRSKKIEKAASVEVSPSLPVTIVEPIRDENGFLKSISYPKKDNGLIDWRKLIPKESIALNKMSFAQRSISIDDLTEEDKNRLIDESPDEDLIIKLSGFRELALIRGAYKIIPKIEHWSHDHVVVSVIINWLPNLENPEGLECGAVASASTSNTDQTFSKFLEVIAENRAFIRAVRHSLGIVSVGQDELKQEDVKVEAQNLKIQSVLSQGMTKANIDISALQILVVSNGFSWNDKWVSVDNIDPAAAMSFIPFVQKIIES